MGRMTILTPNLGKSTCAAVTVTSFQVCRTLHRLNNTARLKESKSIFQMRISASKKPS